MTILYFAGLNTTPFAEALEGRYVLVSYADVIRRPGVWKNEILPRLQSHTHSGCDRCYRAILDSGAFTELSTPGFHVDVREYARFAYEHRRLFDTTVNLDDIRGNIRRSERNLRILRDHGVDALPVFHQGEPWRVLDRMIAKHGYIGVGFQRPIRGARDFLVEFFERAGDVRVHGFGMTRWAREFPFHSADSTTWIAEFRALKTDTRRKIKHYVRKLNVIQRARLVLESYEHNRTTRWTADAWGQASTVLTRFGKTEFTRAFLRHSSVPWSEFDGGSAAGRWA
jgi:hypothetical protein